jgi:cobalt-zinc-cadmium efflux system protein
MPHDHSDPSHDHSGPAPQGHGPHRGHGHHHHVDPDAGDGRVALAVVVNLGLTVVQVIGGILAGSLALIADALHNFSDAVSLIIAYGARRIARRPASKTMSFGWGRAEVVAALINYTTLIIIGLYLVYEALLRFFDPQPVAGWTVIWVAGIALVIDVVTAALTFQLSKSSMNLRAAFLHNVSDALGSVAVILTGILILLYDWRLLDPAATLLIAAYVLWQSALGIGPVIRVLMLAAPEALDPADVVAAIRQVEGVSDLHHVHLWQMQEHQAAFDAHLVVAGDWQTATAVKARVRELVAARFGIAHVTLDLEAVGQECDQPMLYGHG